MVGTEHIFWDCSGKADGLLAARVLKNMDVDIENRHARSLERVGFPTSTRRKSGSGEQGPSEKTARKAGEVKTPAPQSVRARIDGNARKRDCDPVMGLQERN